MTDIKIDCAKIPKAQKDLLSSTLITAVERYFADPAVRRDYEAWLLTEEGQRHAARDAEERRKRKTAFGPI